MGTDGQRRTTRPGFAWWRVALVVVAVLLVLVGGFLLLRRGSVKRRLKALRAAGYPTSFADLDDYKQVPQGVENAADLYMDALVAYSPPVDEANVPLLGRAKLPPRGSPMPGVMAEAVSACLARNAGCLALLRRAGSVAQCRYPWDLKTYSAGLPYLRDLKYCAKLLELAAIAHAERGDTAAALAYIEDGLRLADSLRNEPGLVNYLVRSACRYQSLEGLERVLSATDLTDEQLRDLEETLARIATEADYTEVLVTERALMIEWCKDPSQLGELGGAGRVLKTPGIRNVGLHDCLDYMAGCIEAAKLPAGRRLARFSEIEKELEEKSFLHVLIGLLAPAMTRVTQLDLRRQAHLDLVRTALAIERHRLATGEMPAELGQLVPDYLDVVPTDPFDGRPIRYRRTAPGYILYSIMEDGQDNGGRTHDEVNRGEHYDLCFIVKR
jgi:hypothetical protein